MTFNDNSQTPENLPLFRNLTMYRVTIKNTYFSGAENENSFFLSNLISMVLFIYTAQIQLQASTWSHVLA